MSNLYFVQHSSGMGYTSFESLEKAKAYARKRLAALPKRRSFPIFSYENGKRYLFAKVLRLDRN